MKDIENPFDILSDLNFEGQEFNNEQCAKIEEKDIPGVDKTKIKIRIWLEKKHRAGKPVSIIEGLSEDIMDLKDLSKKMKTKLGVGGSVVGSDILIQSQNRDQIIKILIDEGFKDVKKAGG